ncbi:uncharacterized protein BT62DRAFT_1004109 [Guyanagaster necrorhizus]|uniref:Carboxylesterase type B domain-containing protein n=1 Tax=Guyanagaster necrorhizus TaxID=856835 RepID=A0A9P7VXD7_9AGAR|nr:uncharacterized protein BT62DRAFT_1004109 [Guyanagaster necrorhizus MCA 3950]KAG7448317.1 hypothetical protein BT62DRAFT_1004109 [Guyanagaster necrorhizus MCA 3950]
MYYSQTGPGAQAGVKACEYRFTQNSPTHTPAEGVPHREKIDIIYGLLDSSDEPASSMLLGEIIVNYWVSFATTLDPNDG